MNAFRRELANRWASAKRLYFGDQFVPYVFVISVFLFLLFMLVYPICSGFYISLFDRRGNFVGLGNYINMVHSSAFWHAFGLTFYYVVLYTCGIFFVGFVTALICDTAEKQALRGARLVEYLVTLPYAIPDVVAALTWFWMFDYQLGVLNYFWRVLGLPGGPVRWLTSPDLALYSVILAEIWRLFPFHTLVILAAFKTVPSELYEAAELDGAGPLRKFVKITLPMTKPVTSLLLLLTVIWSFKRFTMLWIMTQGGPASASETIVIYIYRQAFQFYNRPYGAAIGMTMFVVVAAMSMAYYAYRRRVVED